MLKRLIIFLLFVQVSYGQTREGVQICLKVQEYVNSFITDKEAENALDKILSVIGASKNFRLQPCDNINNAIAVTFKGNRYILYDKKFMQLITNYTNNWANLFILAHEVGHHINGHTRDAALSAILDDTSLAKQRQEELDADKFAGFVLAKLGASLNQTIAAIDLMATNSDDRYSTHPNKNKRLESIRVGFNNGRPKSNTQKSNLNSNLPYTNSYIAWQKSSTGKENPFEKPTFQAYTFGEIKPVNNSNFGNKPKLIISKKEDKILMEIKDFGTYNVDYRKRTLRYYDEKYEDDIYPSGTSRRQIFQRWMNGTDNCIYPHKIKINGKYAVSKEGTLYHDANGLEELVWNNIDLNDFTRERKVSGSASIELVIGDKTFKFYNSGSRMENEFILSDGVIEISSLFYELKKDHNYKKSNDFLRALKEGKSLFIRLNDDYLYESYNLSEFGLELGGHNADYQNKIYPKFSTAVIWDIKDKSSKYIEFSLSGSSKALDFID